VDFVREEDYPKRNRQFPFICAVVPGQWVEAPQQQQQIKHPAAFLIAPPRPEANVDLTSLVAAYDVRLLIGDVVGEKAHVS
jgi:hypothetical protein